MDADRKYSQRGYQDNNRTDRRNGNGHGEQSKPQGPRPSLDITGPRLPRLVQNVTASRCFSCSTLLPPGTDFTGVCPKCSAQLHCCKQCTHFEPSTRFQCVKPIPVRIPLKDQLTIALCFRRASLLLAILRAWAMARLPDPAPPPIAFWLRRRAMRTTPRARSSGYLRSRLYCVFAGPGPPGSRRKPMSSPVSALVANTICPVCCAKCSTT